MSNLTKAVKPDRSKIDPENGKELKYWIKALDASKEEVLAAIAKVGNSAAAVRKELKTSKLEPDDFPVSADGPLIKNQDGAPIAQTPDPAIARDIADRLNEGEAQREEDKWSA